MLLISPFVGPTKPGLPPTKKVKTAARATTTMALSSGSVTSSLSATASSGAIEGDSSRFVAPQTHPENPLLYKIPEVIHPTYRSIPILAQTCINLVSAWISAVSTWKHLTFLQPLAVLRGLRPTASAGELIIFAIKALLLSLVTQMALQDLFLPPSRISIKDLCKKFYLPSVISKYEDVSVTDSNGNVQKIGAHYLKYTPKGSASSQNATKVVHALDVIYAHHGFGASSLSFLPVLPSLVNRLGARCGLSHDMVGFGFTDRQEKLEWYTTDASARISRSILDKETKNSNIQSALLLGHSLGAIGVLKMALKLPQDLSKSIILASPALGLTEGFPSHSTRDDNTGPLLGFKNKVKAILQNFVGFPIGCYILRRLVGLKNSWRFGLKSTAWGDPTALKDSDVLRYQWPSIGEGWERGLLKFASAQRRSDDVGLLRQVLLLPNTSVSIIVGEKDRVIPVKITQQFLANFSPEQVKMIQLKGLGHNSFEEDVEGFISAVENIFQENSCQGSEKSSSNDS